jgi:AbrB family looped-hinge helix DNA binding protein
METLRFRDQQPFATLYSPATIEKDISLELPLNTLRIHEISEGMTLVDVTKLSRGYQTVVPASIRKKFGLREGDRVVWSIIGDEVCIRMRKAGEDPLTNLIASLPTGDRANATEEIDEVVYEGE